MEEVRKNIDEVDEKIVELISRRGYFVKQAAKFKKSRKDVKASGRVEEVIEKVRGLARQQGVSPDIVDNIYRTMIENFIKYEMDNYSKK